MCSPAKLTDKEWENLNFENVEEVIDLEIFDDIDLSLLEEQEREEEEQENVPIENQLEVVDVESRFLPQRENQQAAIQNYESSLAGPSTSYSVVHNARQNFENALGKMRRERPLKHNSNEWNHRKNNNYLNRRYPPSSSNEYNAEFNPPHQKYQKDAYAPRNPVQFQQFQHNPPKSFGQSQRFSNQHGQYQNAQGSDGQWNRYPLNPPQNSQNLQNSSFTSQNRPKNYWNPNQDPSVRNPPNFLYPHLNSPHQQYQQHQNSPITSQNRPNNLWSPDQDHVAQNAQSSSHPQYHQRNQYGENPQNPPQNPQNQLDDYELWKPLPGEPELDFNAQQRPVFPRNPPSPQENHQNPPNPQNLPLPLKIEVYSTAYANSVYLDTRSIAVQIVKEMNKKDRKIGQKLFADIVLGRGQSTFSELLKSPKEWDSLINGKESFIRMFWWLNSSEELRISTKEMKSAEEVNRKFGFPPATPSPPKKNTKKAEKMEKEKREILDELFQKNPYPQLGERKQYAEQLKLTEKQIDNYFSNTRRRKGGNSNMSNNRPSPY